MPRFYFDFGQARRWAEKGQTPWTPAVSVLFGLQVGVRRLLAEGREHTWRRHAALATAVQAGLEALGLDLVAPPGHRSATVSAAWLPDDIEWPVLNRTLRERGLAVAGGQGKWAGKILRFGHMGDVRLSELTDALRLLGDVLPDFDRPADADAAVAAAEAAYQELSPTAATASR